MPMPNVSVAARQQKPVAVLCGGSTSHTLAIAERVTANLQANGVPAESHNLERLKDLDLSRCAGAALLAPVEHGKHAQAVVDFVKAHRAELDRLPVAFISVSLAETGGQVLPDVPGLLGQFEGDVQTAPNPLFAETGWRPMRVKSFAGAISYTRYNFFVRMAMKLLAGKEGAARNAARGYENTDWSALDIFVQEFVWEIREAADRPSGGPSATSVGK
jgi:menaquinone-dependent protoporphyrinogen oxidase